MHSAGELIISMVRRPQGATLPELMDATGWQNHSIRGYISNIMRKDMGLPIPRYDGRYHIQVDPVRQAI